ncbi:MAG: nucleotidyltransferase family protein [Thermoplasmata archaeon]
MKAVITAAGLGTRSGLNGTFRKELLPLYEVREGKLVLRPVLDIVAFRLMNFGVREVAIVLDPEDSVTISYVEKACPFCRIIYQRERKGFGDAVLQAREFVGKDSFILAAGDAVIMDFSVIEDRLRASIAEDRGSIFVMRVKNASRYGVAILDASDPPRVRGAVEKPVDPPSNYAICAFYLLPSRIFEFIGRTGGKEMTDAINLAAREGVEFIALEISRRNWISVGVAGEYLDALKTSYLFAVGKRKD